MFLRMASNSMPTFPNSRKPYRALRMTPMHCPSAETSYDTGLDKFERDVVEASQGCPNSGRLLGQLVPASCRMLRRCSVM